MIEDDLQADLPGIGHDPVHDLQPVEPGQIRVLAEVDAGGRAAGVKQLVGEGQADGVEPQIRHLLHHLLVVARMQAVRRIAVRLQAKPVHAGNLHPIARRINNLIALRTQISCYQSLLQVIVA